MGRFKKNPNQMGDQYGMLGLNNVLYKTIAHSCLRGVFQFMRGQFYWRMFQFKRVFICKLRYLLGMSLGVEVFWGFSIKML